MKKSVEKVSLKSVLFRNTLFAVLFWTALILAFAFRGIGTLKNSTCQLAKKEAETHFQLDESFRKWTAFHGGFYVPVDSLTKPSPYLSFLKNRDIVTPSGDTLTLINPARALRLMDEFSARSSGVAGHITSLKLLRPENAPDAWEKKALLAFENGKKEVKEVTEINGKQVFRLMRPLIVEKRCLKCHAKQGYKVGDIRGGVSITVPLSDYLAQEQKTESGKIIAYLVIWLLGMVSIYFSAKNIYKRNVEVKKIQNKLKESNSQLEKRVEERTKALEDINVRLKNEISERIKTEAVRKINEERYKGIIMSTASCIAVYEAVEDGQNFRFVEFNPMAEKAENISREQVVGRLITDVFPAVIEFGFFKVLQNVYQTGTPVHFPIKLYKDKRISGYRENYVYKLSSGEVVAVYQDVTQRKRTELAQQIVYNISNAVTTSKNIEDLIAKVQQEISKVMDASNFYVALYNKNSDELYMPYYFDEHDNFLSAPAKNTLSKIVIKSGKSLLATNEIKRQLEQKGELVRQGTYSKVWLGVPLFNEKGDVIGVVAVQNYEDENAYSQKDVEMLEFIAGQISLSIQRKKNEDELRDALSKAEESDRLKSAFLANMSHEIRTPMNGILGFAALLKEPELSGEEIRKYTDIIQISGERMLNIINNLIDISKIEAGQMKIYKTACNVNEQLEYLKMLFFPEVEKKQLSIHVMPGLSDKKSIINTDSEKLYAILSNLIKNAIKYTHEGSIEAGYVKKDNVLEFYVMDTGIGIPKERQSAIFDRFVQADIEDRQVYEGAGLGLTISKAFVDMLGGKIWVESIEGKGSKFYFTIPYTPVGDEKEEIEQKKDEPVAQKQIPKKASFLIVDDEPVSTSYLAEIIKNISSKIYYADNGVSALEEFEKHPDIDIILMDMKMPVMNGYEATKKIRETNKEVVIIAQTAYALKDDRNKSMAVGCTDYIAKPVDKDELIKLIHKYL